MAPLAYQFYFFLSPLPAAGAALKESDYVYPIDLRPTECCSGCAGSHAESGGIACCVDVADVATCGGDHQRRFIRLVDHRAGGHFGVHHLWPAAQPLLIRIDIYSHRIAMGAPVRIKFNPIRIRRF